MKSRWQKSLEAAVAAYDTPLPWERGEARKSMITRRKTKTEETGKRQTVESRRA